MTYYFNFFIEKGNQIRNIQIKANVYLALHTPLLLTLCSVILLSLLFFPLPIPIFFTLVYGSFSYALIFIFKLIEKYPEFIHSMRTKISFTMSKKHSLLITISFVLLIFLSLYFIIIPFEGFLVDVDDAIISAVQGFSNGINPYKEPIVAHTYDKDDFADLTTDSSPIHTYATYNYLPVDLLLYYIGFKLFSPFVGTNWFYLTNFLAFCACIYLFSRFHPISKIHAALLFLPSIFFAGLILNDIWLILLFLLFLIWLDTGRDTKLYNLVAVTALTIGFLTKMLMIFLLPVFLLYITNKWRVRIYYAIYSGILSLVVISFFDVIAVMRSVFLFHSNLETRGQLAFVGGILAIPLQFYNLSAFYIPVFIILFALVLLTAKYFSSKLEGQMLYVSAIVILLLPSGNFIPFLLVIGLTSSYRVFSNTQFNLVPGSNQQHCTTTST